MEDLSPLAGICQKEPSPLAPLAKNCQKGPSPMAICQKQGSVNKCEFFVNCFTLKKYNDKLGKDLS